MLPQSSDGAQQTNGVRGQSWIGRGKQEEDDDQLGPKRQRGLFADIMNLKAKNRAEVLGEGYVYNVMDFYKTEGKIQQIARTSLFENTTLFVIGLNAIYIGIDTQYNKASTLAKADAEFMVCEQLFTVYFFSEIMIRFLAFEHKINAFKDRWFQFDGTLVTLMVIENWIMLMANSSGGGLSGLSILRLLRLLRLTRMVRLMRAVPEFLTLIKGMVAATRSVASTLALLIIFNYVFAIIFTEMLKDEREYEFEGETVFDDHFGSLGMSMYTLFIAGTLLDDIAGILKPFLTYMQGLLWVFLLFVLISAFTILNMLIGILCEVISKTAETEQEKMLIKEAKDRLTSVFHTIDRDGSGRVSQREFDLMQNEPEVEKAFQSLGVESKDILALSDSLFEQDEGGAGKRELTFGQFLDVVTHMRPENTASVLDIADIRKTIRRSTKNLEARVMEIAEAVATLQQAQGIPVTVQTRADEAPISPDPLGPVVPPPED